MSEPRCTLTKVEPAAQEPLVSIGVPVRNGAAFLEEALRHLVEQTHANLEIIISDNASSDGTSDIIERFALNDTRIRVYTQSQTLTAFENFRFVFEQASGEFFMWAAHDDRHSPTYVEYLLIALQRDPGASLAFSDVSIFHRTDAWRDARCIPYDFVCDATVRFWRGLLHREYIRAGYLHIYGLIRRRALDGYRWPDIELGGDRPLLLYLWCRGRFVRADGACYYCFKPERKKSHEQRAKYTSGSGLRRFPYLRLSWVCAQAAHAAEALEGRQRNRYLIFSLLLLKEVWKQNISKLRRVGGQVLRGLKGART